MSKRILSLVLALVMVLGTFGTVFADHVPTGSAKIDWLVEQGMVKGNEAGDLMLDSLIDRASTARMIAIALDLEEEAAALKLVPSGFKDLTIAHWANGYANLAAGKSLIVGDESGNFMPAKDITYGEVAAVLVRLVMGRDLTAAERGTAGSWMAPYISKASELGILEGLSIKDFNAKANRREVLEMFYNAMINMEVGNYSIVKAIVLENNRVESLNKDEVVVEVIRHIQVANYAGASRKDHGDQERYVIDAKVADVENLLGKVVDFTLAKGDKVVEAKIDASFDYVSGAIKATKNRLEVNGKTYTVELDERYKDSDERIFRTYYNDKAHSYEDFYRDVNVTTNRDEFEADFAKVTVKNGKVLFIDAFGFNDVAPVKEVKDSNLVVYNDERNGADKVVKEADLKYVLVVEGEKVTRGTLADVKSLDVAHFYNKDKNVIVKKDAAVNGTFDKVSFSRDFKDVKVVVDGKDYKVSDLAARRAVYSLNLKDFYTLYGKDADKQLREFNNQKVTVLTDLNGNVQYITTEVDLGEFVALLSDVLSRDVRVIKADNAKDEFRVTFDSLLEFENSTKQENLNNFRRGDLVYTSVKEKDVDSMKRLVRFDVAGNKAEFKADENYINVANKDYRLLDRTNVFIRTNDELKASTIKDVADKAKYDQTSLKAIVVTDKYFNDQVKEARGLNTDRDDIAHTIVFTDATPVVKFDAKLAQVQRIYSSGRAYELKVLFSDDTVKEYEVRRGSAAYDKLNTTNLNRLAVEDIVKLSLTKETTPQVEDFEIVIAKNAPVFEVTDVRAYANYRILSVKDTLGRVEDYFLYRDADVFGYIQNGSKISFTRDTTVNLRDIDALVVRAANAGTTGIHGSDLPTTPDTGRVTYINSVGDRLEVDRVIYVLDRDTRLVNSVGTTLAIGNVDIARMLVRGDRVEKIEVVNGVVKSLVKVDGSAVTTAQLRSAIVDAETKNQADYTAATWAPFATALAQAQSVYGNVNATQAQIDAAYANLVNAQTALVNVNAVVTATMVERDLLGLGKFYEISVVGAALTDVTQVLVNGTVEAHLVNDTNTAVVIFPAAALIATDVVQITVNGVNYTVAK